MLDLPLQACFESVFDQARGKFWSLQSDTVQLHHIYVSIRSPHLILFYSILIPWYGEANAACLSMIDMHFRGNYYSSTCHGRPPLVQRKSGPSWQVAPRDRERTYAPLCQIKHTHQTAYISQHMHNIMKHSGQLQCCIGLQWEMKRTMLKMCEQINSSYPQCNAYFKICRSNRRRFEMSLGNWPL